MTRCNYGRPKMSKQRTRRQKISLAWIVACNPYIIYSAAFLLHHVCVVLSELSTLDVRPQV